MRTRSSKGTRRKGAGQAVVEFALIAPVVFLLLLIAVDFGRLFFTYVAINNAAREGAAYASGSPNDCGGTPCLATSGIAVRASQETNSQTRAGGATTIDVSVTCANQVPATILCSDAFLGGSGVGNTVTVNATQPFNFFTPLINNFFGNNLKITGTATAPVFGYVANGGGTPPGLCSAPVASFTVSILAAPPAAARTIQVDPAASTPNSGVCNISGYNWSWNFLGDPTDTDVGTASAINHTYAADGTYVITLEVTNQGGTSTTQRTVTVPAGAPPPTCAKPTANFDWTTTGNGSNTIYTYHDKSTVVDGVNCPITDWLWTFTDMPPGPLQSNAQNPASFKYPNSSSHPVTLKVTNAGGSSSITINS